jgi:hypothetical protein
MKLYLPTLFFIFCSGFCFSQTYIPGSHVEILEGHTWYPGKVLQVKGDQYKIHYDMYTNDIFDIWVKTDRLRSMQGHAVLPAKNTLPPSGNGVLYSGSSITGGTVYYYIYPSGQIVRGCPTGGLETFNYSAFCNSVSDACGRYTKSGNNITITWNSGTGWTGRLKPNGDMEINSSLVGPVKKVPVRIVGSYDFTINTSGMSVAETISFKDDGTYAVSRASGYDHNDRKNSAEWQSNSSGTYAINGFTITLNDKNSKTAKHTIYSLDETKSPDYLGWDGNFLSRKTR